MEDVSGPSIVRYNRGSYIAKPGLHSYNINRRLGKASIKVKTLRKLQTGLLILGLCGIGYYGYALSNQYVYQAYENWAFDQQIAGRPAVTFGDYLRERTPFAFLAGGKAVTPAASVPKPAPAGIPGEVSRPSEGSLLGRVEIGRLNLAAMVREGVDAKTLSMAVGHVPTTALPGQAGNFAIAAHRDTLFRALKDIKKSDLVKFESASGTYTYEVVSTKIVKPSDVSVLQPDGGLSPATAASSGGSEAENNKLLTMITCYPFYYVGAAPKRFIVQARLLRTDSASTLSASEAAKEEPAPKPLKRAEASKLRHSKASFHVRATRPPINRGAKPVSNQAPKKRGFWHKVFHVS